MYQILLSATLLTTTFANWENNPININFDNCTRSPLITVIVSNNTIKETILRRIPYGTPGFYLERNDEVTSYITFTKPNYLFVQVVQGETRWESYYYGEVNNAAVDYMMQDIRGGHYKKAVNCAEYSTTLNNDEPRASKTEVDPESAFKKDL
ncbi:hypothetical protein Q1695_015925 [Nippostrongylus brasiliensis]|nr:hypothetical protein Q1695_015925 [Nippostrongylus brasiliensis]